MPEKVLLLFIVMMSVTSLRRSNPIAAGSTKCRRHIYNGADEMPPNEYEVATRNWQIINGLMFEKNVSSFL